MARAASEIVEKEREKGKKNDKSALAWEYGGLDPKDPRGYKFGRTMSTASVTRNEPLMAS